MIRPGKIALIVIALLLFAIQLSASERQLFSLGKSLYQKKEFFSAITEFKRQQFLYPKGRYFDQSLFYQGKAYMEGGNYQKATDSLYRCYNDYAKKKTGQLSLFYLAYYRLRYGSAYYAIRGFQQFNYIYPKGFFKQHSDYFLCFAAALYKDDAFTKKTIRKYLLTYPDGSNYKKVLKLKEDLYNEINRTKKSILLAGIGSAIIPGFGYFYTEQYALGSISFLTNAVLIFLIYNSIRTNNMYQTLLFSVMELGFYQNSIYGAINSVQKYNSRIQFHKKLHMGLSQNF